MYNQVPAYHQHYQNCIKGALSCSCAQNNKGKSLKRVYRRDESLFCMGDKFEALYMLKLGSAKSFSSTESGHEQITHFHFPGDLIGFEGFDKMVHVHSLRFLEHSTVCRISMYTFNRLMIASGTSRGILLSKMSHSFVDEQKLLQSLVKHDAEQRLVRFLLNIAAKNKQMALPYQVVNLSMTRGDIANYLGMAIETISRLLSKMHTQGLINVNRREITLCNIENLHASLST
jgi:CRP/FNR family transcriptional regulator